MCSEAIEPVHMRASLAVAVRIVLRHLPQGESHIGRIATYLPNLLQSFGYSTRYQRILDTEVILPA